MSFSLRSVAVAVVLAAISMSHAMTSYKLWNAKRELELARSNYGYMQIKDLSKINAVSLQQGDGQARFVVEERYFLHLSEIENEASARMPSGPHHTTIALNDWTDGEDTILNYHQYVDPKLQSPYVHVGSNSEDYFQYRPSDWRACPKFCVR